jgi:hypothetical protein
MQNAHQGHLAANSQLGAIFFRRARELGDRTFIKLQHAEHLDEVSWREFSTKDRHTMQRFKKSKLIVKRWKNDTGEISMRYIHRMRPKVPCE